MLTITLFAAPLAQASTLRSFGSTGSDVKTLQSELLQLGYNVGPLNGIFGTKTLTSVKTFQADNNLKVDGIVGPLTNQTLTTQGIITTANRLLGSPYLWGGTTTAGFDCSGFTQYVFKSNGITLPRTSKEQYQVGVNVNFNDLIQGDLVFFTFTADHQAGHVGIYLGNNQFISATLHKGVVIYSFTPYWSKAYVGAKRAIK
ncbi:MAG: C40 family peptidase [Desulfitobacteriaceae bacterium]